MSEDMIITVSFFTTVIVLALGIPLVRAYTRRRERHGTPLLSDVEQGARLARIESAVESMAIEIERISEGQRFTTQLLTARAGAAELANAPRAERSGEERR